MLYLPMPPSMNNLYPSNRQGRRYKNKNHIFFKTLENYLLAQTRQIKELRDFARQCEFLFIRRQFFFNHSSLYTKRGSVKRMDVSNRIKVIDDELEKILNIDDSCFWAGSEEKIEMEVEGMECVIVSIEKHKPKKKAVISLFA